MCWRVTDCCIYPLYESFEMLGLCFVDGVCLEWVYTLVDESASLQSGPLEVDRSSRDCEQTDVSN
jgi:hypothetical protein